MATVAIVEKHPWGTVHHNQCVADVFTQDMLTISCPEMGDLEMAVYAPDRWKSVAVFDGDGHLLYAHINESIRELDGTAATDALRVAVRRIQERRTA